MEELKIPTAPMWNVLKGVVITPDNGFLYIGSKSVNYISSIKDVNSTPKIKYFPTRQSIRSIDVDPDWNNEKYFAILAQDNTIQIWDLEKGYAIKGHRAHAHTDKCQEGVYASSYMNDKKHRVLMGYMRNRSVLSVNATDIVVYCVASNTFCNRPMFVSSRNQYFTALSCSTHDDHIFALGTSRGLVVVCNVQNMSVIMTLRGHNDQPVTSLSWSFKTSRNEEIKNESTVGSLVAIKPTEEDDIFDANDYDYLENEFGVLSSGNAMESDTEACKNLKQEIESTKDEASIPTDYVGDSQQIEIAGGNGIVVEDEDYNENSMEIIPRSSSDDSVHVDGAEGKSRVQILHQAEVHATQTLERKEIEKRLDTENIDKQDKTIIAVNKEEECHLVSLSDNRKPEDNVSLIRITSEDFMNIDFKKSSKETFDICYSDKNVIVEHVYEEAIDDSSKLQTDKQNENTLLSVTIQTELLNDEIKNVDQDFSTNNENTTVDKGDQKHSKGDAVAADTVAGVVLIGEHIYKDDLRVNNGSSYDDILLLSTTLRSTYVWNMRTGTVCASVSRSSNHKYFDAKNLSDGHIEVGWVNKLSYVVNNKHGDLFRMTLKPNKFVNSVQTYTIESVKHNFKQRGVVYFSYSPANDSLWCVSTYREISCELFTSEELILHYSCTSTNIGAIKECPNDMNKIALGLCDRRVGILDLTKMSPSKVFIENYSARIEATVTSLIWSPDGTKLAFGTGEGRVGVINMEAPKNSIVTFNPVFGKAVFSMNWHDNRVFVVCNEMLAMYDVSSKNRDPCIVTGVKKVSVVSIRHGYAFVGTSLGKLQFCKMENPMLKLNMKPDNQYSIAYRYVADIAWSPLAPERMAVACNDNNIQIFNFHVDDNEGGVLTLLRKIDIADSKSGNFCISWSNRNADTFLSCGFDGALRVWNLANADNLQIFSKQYHCPLKCGLFLPTDDNIILCTGKTTPLSFIDMRLEELQQASALKNKKMKYKSLHNNIRWAVKMLKDPSSINKSSNRSKANENQNEKFTDNLSENSVVIDGTDLASIPNDLNVNHKVEATSEISNDGNKDSPRGKQCYGFISIKNPTTLLYLTNRELNKGTLDKMFYLLTSAAEPNNTSYCEKLFGTKKHAQELLNEELSNCHQSNINPITGLFLPQVSVTLKEEILNCIRKKKLTEWHISLAPTISFSFWKKCCEAFSEQLLAQGHIILAATYMMAIQKQQQVIELLLDKNYFKEAMLIARIYLQPDSPLLPTIVEKWISHLDSVGNLTGAALICLHSKQINRAHDLLSKIRTADLDVERIIKLLKTNETFE